MECGAPGPAGTAIFARRVSLPANPGHYGYLAHYNASEGTEPKKWLAKLNQFHINGLEFYDFQYRHDKPLAGTVAHPESSWRDIAGRTVDGTIVREPIDQAHRMLSREYFPADTRLSISPELHDALRHYYDYLTAYENYLRDGMDINPCGVKVMVPGQNTNPLAVPNTIWTITRRKNDITVVHLINLLGSDGPHWRDVQMTRPIPPTLNDLRVHVALPGKIQSVGWASPDIDGVKFHPIPFTLESDKDATGSNSRSHRCNTGTQFLSRSIRNPG